MVRVPPDLYAAHGADFWDDFTESRARRSVAYAAPARASPNHSLTGVPPPTPVEQLHHRMDRRKQPYPAEPTPASNQLLAQ
jgi:hypothetical protein